MGQIEVFEWLKKMRRCGDNNYFFPKDITKGLKNQGLTNGCLCNVRGDCFRLYQGGNGCIEMKDFDKKGITNWKKAFRVKEVYL
jgi:hypothetical protein